MAGFSEEDIRRVRDANDLVGLFSERTHVQQRGRDFWCCCPFHQEKTPSCKIDPAQQTWHCFGCGEGGDAISYVRKLDDVGFVDAVRFLARRANIELEETPATRKSRSKKARLKELCAHAAAYYHQQLMRGKSDQAQKAREYLSSRGLGGAVPGAWQLGFAPGRGELVRHLRSKGFTDAEMVEANVAVRRSGVNDRFYDRVMFPINDVSGECIAFGGRVIGTGEPKYLNSGDTPIFHKSDVLYALDKAKAAMASTGTAIVVEGYTDVIALHQAGFSNTVATLGTSLTRRHIRILSHHAKNRIVYVFDGDQAGQRAADRALQFIDDSITPEAGLRKVDLVAVTLPDDLDPADFMAQRGPEAFQACVDQAVPLVRYGIDRRLSQHDLSTPEGRSRAGIEALQVLAPIKDSLLAKDYAVYIASRVHAREQDLLDRLAQLKPPAVPYEQRQQAPGGAPAPAGSFQPGYGAAGSGQQQGVAAPGQTGGPGAFGPGGGMAGAQGVAAAQGAVPAPGAQRGPVRQLSTAERNRLRSERAYLALCAANPAMIDGQQGTLYATEWRLPLHRELAYALVDAVADSGVATTADVLLRVQATVPAAERVLTAQGSRDNRPAAEHLAFLARELACGDLEQQVSQLRDEIRANQSLSPEEREIYFQTSFTLQQQLNALRAQAVPPPE